MKKNVIWISFIFILSGFLVSQTITVDQPTGGTYSPGSPIRIHWTTTGISSGNVRILLVKEDGSDRKILVGSVSYNPHATLQRPIPNDTLAGTYFIQVRLIGQQVAGRSNTFLVTTSIPMTQLTINLPSRDQKFSLGNPVLVDWLIPVNCGDRVSMYAKRMATGEEYRIIENYSCRSGRNTYNWIVSTPFYYDIRGDYRVKIVTSTGCTKESETFQILSRDEYDAATTVGSDFTIESVTFSNGSSLNHGIGIAPGTNLTDTFTVNIKWNKSRPPRKGSHWVEVTSVLTKESIHTSNQPTNFSYEDANASTGIIRVNVPFAVPANKVLSMKRGRFIPILFKLNINPSSCDCVARNNTKEFNMRVLENVPSADFLVEIVPNTLKVERDKWSKGLVNFEIQIRVRNLAKNDAGGPPAPVNDVKCHWKNHVPGKGTWPGNFTLQNVNTNWVFYTVKKRMYIPRNWWRPVTFSITVDKDNEFLDPNRDNNTASQEYQMPY